jgi:hypothetical protein
VILEPVALRWIKGAADDPADLCAHGDFVFRIGKDTLSDGLRGRELTLSAAALYLLRTLMQQHTQAHPVGDHLFPCCGFSMFEVPGKEDVLLFGCPNGQDFEILHRDGVVVRSADGGEWQISWPEWRGAVFGFADRVSEFYAYCSEKQPSPDDAAGFKKFMAEWERRRGQPFGQRTFG